jgi:hypothetical protein
MSSRDELIEKFITNGTPDDCLQILDALIEPVSNYLGLCPGIEGDRHKLLLQIQKDEQNV